MPIFTRRRLQAMLDDLAPFLDDGKAKDFLGRLAGKKAEQVIPAEMELALVWAVAKLGDLDIEPHWWGDDKRPDCYTEHLLPDTPVVIEVTSPNDNDLSGEEAMAAVANELGAVADRVKRKTSPYLYYSFAEESGYEDGQYFRRRLTPPGYKCSERVRRHLTRWITEGHCDRMPVRVRDKGLDVVIEKKSYKQVPLHNTWSLMPPETHSLEENHLYGLLRRKLIQLKASPTGSKRMLFLADAGSTLLRKIGTIHERTPSNKTFSGVQIIRHFLERHRDRVDAIAVFAPRRSQGGPFLAGELKWSVTLLSCEPEPALERGLKGLAAKLPSPRYEGYQARSLFQQGAFATTARARYLSMSYSSRREGKMKVRFSSRLLLDLLAGRITERQFRAQVDGSDGHNIIEHWLKQGLTISGASMAPREIDTDDDHIIFELTDDVAARALAVDTATRNAQPAGVELPENSPMPDD
jgi:hypothetical protein